jgi:hydroxymethylpyrimidine pyrophosphatase-like HAD family hydrolase
MREALALAKATIAEQVVAPGLGYFQPGKEVSISVLPSPGQEVDGLRLLVEAALSAHSSLLTVQTSVDCVDVTPPGIDKGAGLRWLSDVVDIPLEGIGGIGDSSSDLSFLRLVGQSAAPANAVAEVKASVAYLSAYEDGDGVVDILHYWIGRA